MNVCLETWAEDKHFDGLVLWNQYIYTRNKEFISNCIIDKTFCDCNGNLYKVFELVIPTSLWRRFLYFLPNIYKTELRLRRTGEKISVDELRRFMLDRLRERPPDKFYNQIKKDLKLSNSFIKLMFFGAEN